jgi:hypothetical protein
MRQVLSTFACLVDWHSFEIVTQHETCWNDSKSVIRRPTSTRPHPLPFRKEASLYSSCGDQHPHKDQHSSLEKGFSLKLLKREAKKYFLSRLKMNVLWSFERKIAEKLCQRSKSRGIFGLTANAGAKWQIMDRRHLAWRGLQNSFLSNGRIIKDGIKLDRKDRETKEKVNDGQRGLVWISGKEPANHCAVQLLFICEWIWFETSFSAIL